MHSGDDASGAEVHRALLAALLASGIEILDRTVALDLVVENPAARGRGRWGGAGTGTGHREADGRDGGCQRRSGWRRLLGRRSLPAGLPD